MRESLAVFLALGMLGCSSADSQTAANFASLEVPVSIQIKLESEVTAQLPSAWQYIPDEHTSVIPPAPGDNRFLVFAAGAVNSDGGAMAMHTSDFVHFTQAYSSPVLSPPKASCAYCIPGSPGTCSPSLSGLYDNNYAAPGTVLQDPAAPDGTYLMIYQAENHCRGGQQVDAFYASVGLARSTDFGQTWPAAHFGLADRYAAVTSETPDPLESLSYNALGNAIPSALVDGGYLYVYFTSFPGAMPPAPDSNHAIEVARAIDDGNSPLTFSKLSSIDPQNPWGQPGLGGIGSHVITPPPGTSCGQASVNRLVLDGKPSGFIMTMMCGGNESGGWYYSQSTSLADQSWTAPTLIAGSDGPITNGVFDGWYPSFVSQSKTTPAGTLDGNDVALFANGDLTGARTMGVKKVKISAQ